MSIMRITSETLTSIANAIRAKTGKSATMTPAQMVTEIGTISGGGYLPPVISKIDGGSFTLANKTVASYQIPHTLGVAPKGFVIWTDGVDISNAGNNIVIRGVFIVDKSANGSLISYLYQMATYNSNFNSYARNVGADYSDYANTEYISFNVSNALYEANVTYKWFAWA